MKLLVRRVGNSLGVILPKSVLDEWGVSEGDTLNVTERGIRVPSRAGFSQSDLDEHKRSLSLAVVRDFSAQQIRAQILANLHRWKDQGMWISAYDEWRDLAGLSDDGALYAVMLGRDDRAVRLRQSMPFVGLLPRSELRRLNEKAAG